ncbi:MAG: ATP-dependent DNA helicase RecG [Gammaproteobacteria bacterium]|nr:ATP-dependent DNA helicase RecG [Gammaproteobacteria bacterium]NNF62238.1 ATP-dependent DNA helicase RecG [Gammaproteobacteria bacterium]NNM21035.1 ATP-dependent DNA helicase RecG [Gammaproteobacteria bacterium]
MLRPTTELSGVGPALAQHLERIGVTQVADLLFHLPVRYEDRTQVRPIGGLQAGDKAVFEGEIQTAAVVYRGRRMLIASLADGTGQITLRFFHFSRFQQKALERGARLRCFGEVRRGRGGLEIAHPEYRVLREGDTDSAEDHLTPVYPTTEGLQQGRLRMLTGRALEELVAAESPELLPDALTAGMDFPSLRDALLFVHRPPPGTDTGQLMSCRHPAQQRLAFEELLAHHLSLRRLRENVRVEQSLSLPADGPLQRRFIAALPFTLTGAQQRALGEIGDDLACDNPMMRLLQGDVGSGKTVVAAGAALCAADAGHQVAIMAPTELLAEQHLATFRDWFEPLGIDVVWLSGRLKVAQRRAALTSIAAGAPVVIGTHALFQEGVEFGSLALVVIDEQHRFGVHQRLALREKGAQGSHVPHQLVMTATPIPRTLAMTAYADLDTSVIDEKPPGRKPVETVALPDNRRADVVQRVATALRDKRQVYWVCPLIEESDQLEAEAAENTASALAEALPDYHVALVHGRVKPEQRDRVMQAFKDGKVDLLVATTVIEVGVDVPNASLMIIENAERMGLAQLHQLRGRVGRGSDASSCVLLYKPPLSRMAKERLGVLRRTDDGFEVASKDLELRGAGELLGTRQTGLIQMKVADLVRDAHLIGQVQRSASQLLAEQPDVVARLIRRWIGEAGARYGKV